MTVKLQELAIKSELKVAMRYKNFKTVAMRCENKYICMSLCLKPLASSAFWYGGMASSKTFWLYEMLASRLICWCFLGCSSVVRMGDCFVGGRRGFCCWVPWRVCKIHLRVRSRVTSRKFTVCRVAKVQEMVREQNSSRSEKSQEILLSIKSGKMTFLVKVYIFIVKYHCMKGRSSISGHCKVISMMMV